MYGIICFILLQNFHIPRDANPQLYNQLTEGINNRTRIAIKDIEEHLIEIVENEKSFDSEERKKGAVLAYKVQALSLSLSGYIDSIKNNISTSAKKQDCYVNDRAIQELSLRINRFLDTSLSTMRPEIRMQYNDEIKQEIWNGEPGDTVTLQKIFRYQSKEEAIAILSALKLNIIISTQLIIREIYLEHGYFSENITPLYTFAVPYPAFVFKGEELSATIFRGLPTFSTVIYTCNTGKLKTENRRGYLFTKAQSPGIHILSGTATIKERDSIYTKTWSTNYYVAPKGIYMHIDNANWCYAGVPFTMSVSLEEYTPDKLILRSKDAIIEKQKDGVYTITANKGIKSFMVYMDAINKDNSISTCVAAKHIKVLQPVPDIAIGSIKNGTISKAYIIQHAKLSAISKDDELDIRYNIKQYSISSIKANNNYIEPITVAGDNLNADNDIIRSIHSGDRIYITDVIVNDNYGNTHIIPATSFRIE